MFNHFTNSTIKLPIIKNCLFVLLSLITFFNANGANKIYNDDTNRYKKAEVSKIRLGSSQLAVKPNALSKNSYIVISEYVHKSFLSIDSTRFSLKPVVQIDAVIIPTDTIKSTEIKDNRLNEVVITAQGRNEDPNKTPVAVSVISAEKIRNNRIWNIQDITARIPNLYIANPGDLRNVTSIRGVVNTSYDPAVATYVDGVNQFSLDTYIPDLYDVERIEVLRGPQGTLFGRNAMGGVINIITKQPSNTRSGFFEAGIGNFNQTRYHGAFKSPIIKDKLFAGASGVFTKNAGFFRNEFNDSNFDQQRGDMGNYFLKYLPTTKLVMILNVKHSNKLNNGAFPLASNVKNAFSMPFILNQNAVAQMVDRNFNTSFAIKYAGANINQSLNSSYQSNLRRYKGKIDGDFSPLDIVAIGNDFGKKFNRVNVFMQEYRIGNNKSSTDAIKWDGGMTYFYQDNPTKQGAFFGADAALFGAEQNTATVNTNIFRNFGIASFGEIRLKLNEVLTAIGGLRYDYESKRLSSDGFYQQENQTNLVTQTATTSTAFNSFSPKLSISYQPNKNSLLFASYNRGFRAGGITPLSSDPSTVSFSVFKPEYNNSFELGLKQSAFNNLLQINIAAFMNTITDIQTPTLILPDGITVTKNTGKLSSRGLELEINAQPFKNFKLEYSAGYTSAKYANLDISSNGTSENLAGNRQIFTPKITSNTFLQYQNQLSKTKETSVTMVAEWTYTGTQFFDLANQIKQSGYHLLNARLGFSIKNFGVFAWANNLANQKYIAYAYEFGAAHLGNPKTFGMSFSANF